MTQQTIEFFWDVGSPYTFLASTRIEELAQSCDARAEWRPFLLGGVFRETGNRPPLEVPAKLNYMLDDLKTWADHYKMSFAFPSVRPSATERSWRVDAKSWSSVRVGGSTLSLCGSWSQRALRRSSFCPATEVRCARPRIFPPVRQCAATRALLWR